MEEALKGVPVSGELATALADVKRLRQEAEQKASELDKALARLQLLMDQDPPNEPEVRRPVAVPQPLRPVAEPGNGEVDEALLKATQMAVAGGSRSDIEATLRDEYGVTEPARLVAQVLGPPREAG